MSLPRFLRSFQKKPNSNALSLRAQNSDLNLSDCSSSSSSSGPKDALGFPLPVTTVVTTVRTVAAVSSSNASSTCSSPTSFLYPGPMDIVTNGAPAAVSVPNNNITSINSDANSDSDSDSNTNTTSHNNTGRRRRPAGARTKNNTSRPSSRSFVHRGLDGDDPTVFPPALSTSCPQLSSPLLSASASSVPPIPVPTANFATRTLGFDMTSTPVQDHVRGRKIHGKDHDDHPQHHPAATRRSRSRSNTMASGNGSSTGATTTGAADVDQRPEVSTMTSSPSLESVARLGPDAKAVPRISYRPPSHMQERATKTRSVCSNVSSTGAVAEAVAEAVNPSNVDPQQQLSVLPLTPTRSRSLSSPHAAIIPPVSILKNKPKSILRSRSRSGSQPLPPSGSPSSHDLVIPAFPAPPTNTRTLNSAGAPSMARTSLYLLHDPMVEMVLDEFSMDGNQTRKPVSIHSQRRLSNRDLDGVQSAFLSSSPPPEHSLAHFRSRMPSTPTLIHTPSDIGSDQEDFKPALIPQQDHQYPETSTSQGNHLSFPSLSELKAAALITSRPSSPLPSPSPNSTSLTPKSARAAKSRNKLRHEPQIGTATAMRRSSLAPVATDGSFPAVDGSSYGSADATLSSDQQLPGDVSPPVRRREHSISSITNHNMLQLLPRPILKDTSARDRLQRESWMSEPPGITLSGSHTSGVIRPASAFPSSPVAPPKSLARVNSAKRQSKLSRSSTLEHDQDALTPRPRHASFGYGPDYRPRRQSGGPGHLLYGFDATSSNTGFESEDYDDSDMDDTHQHSKQLQEQYSLLQKSHRVVTGSNLSVAGDQSTEGDVPYIAKRGQRKSLGDELDGPPVPEKSVQRKRVSTMGSATLPAVPSALTSALILSNNGSTSDTTLPILRSTSQRQRDRRPYGTVGPNLLSFEPLFALKDFTPSSIKNEEQLLGESKDSGTSRLSAVSDADWYSALLTINLNQQGVSVLDLSKRELTEIPLSLPASITHLRLAYNTIRTLSPMTSLASLNHLQVLDLCDNHLEILPPEIGLLTKLKELYLSNNKLWKLPDNIQKMARLEVLDIRNNQFYLLNPMVGRLKALRQLDVRYNQLKSLPAPLCMVSSTLTVLLADGNNFVSPFLELLQPLMVEDKDSTGSGRQSFLSDDPYADPNSSNVGSVPAKVVSVYEPWRRSITPNSSRRLGGGAPTLTKRRSHGDLMSLMGLQKKDEGASTDDSGSVASGSHMLTSSSGAQVTVSRNAENASTRRERSVSTSTVTHATEMHSDNTTVHPLSFNKLLKSIRKGSRSSMREGSSSSKSETTTKRHSIGNEFDQLGDNDSDLQDTELKQNSKGSSIVRGPSGRRATASGINQWVRDRFQKGTNSTDLGTLTDGNSSAISLSTDKPDGGNEIAVRDSGYGSGVSGSKLGPSLGSTPDLSQTLHQGRGSSIFDIRFQNKSTGHLPHGSPIVPQNAQFSSPIDTSFKKEKDGRHSYISVESQMTQGTDNESEIAEIDAAIAHQFQQQQQHHRLSSVHSPTTPLPSSPIIGGVSTDGNEPRNWNPADPRFGQSAAQLRPLMQYLKDLHDLDPDSSEWEEVYAWRRVWNAERSTATGVGVGTDDINAEDPAVQQEKQAKDEEIRIAKLQAQASRRRRIIDEILSTERTYVEGLKGLVEIYLTPALQIMPPGDHKAVFSNAQAIYTFHADHFLPALEKAYQVAFDAAQRKQDSIAAQAIVGPLSPIPTSDSLASSPGESATAGQVSDISTTSSQPQDASTDSVPGAEDTVTIAPPVAISAEDAIKKAVEDRIGRVFAEHVPYMKMYSFYINNYDNALRVLQTQLTQAKHKKKMKEFLRRCAKHPNHTQLALQGYLLLPVQRIPRYKLLLQDLLENTWADHVDHQDIAMALEKISSRADEMNERKRQYENHEKVLLVQNRIIGQYKTPLVQPHRKVVREGMLHLIRVVTRNVSMGVDKVAPISHSNVPLVGDLTVHHLSEDTVEKSFLFILFNDIMIQCNPLAGKAAGGNNGSNGNSGSNGSSTGSSVNGSGASVGGSSMAGGGSGSGSANSDAGVKNLELCRVLQLESRLHPAEVIGQDVLRVVDDAMVLYLTGDKDVIHAWKEDINSRW